MSDFADDWRALLRALAPDLIVVSLLAVLTIDHDKLVR